MQIIRMLVKDLMMITLKCCMYTFQLGTFNLKLKLELYGHITHIR